MLNQTMSSPQEQLNDYSRKFRDSFSENTTKETIYDFYRFITKAEVAELDFTIKLDDNQHSLFIPILHSIQEILLNKKYGSTEVQHNCCAIIYAIVSKVKLCNIHWDELYIYDEDQYIPFYSFIELANIYNSTAIFERLKENLFLGDWHQKVGSKYPESALSSLASNIAFYFSRNEPKKISTSSFQNPYSNNMPATMMNKFSLFITLASHAQIDFTQQGFIEILSKEAKETVWNNTNTLFELLWNANSTACKIATTIIYFTHSNIPTIPELDEKILKIKQSFYQQCKNTTADAFLFKRILLNQFPEFFEHVNDNSHVDAIVENIFCSNRFNVNKPTTTLLEDFQQKCIVTGYQNYQQQNNSNNTESLSNSPRVEKKLQL